MLLGAPAGEALEVGVLPQRVEGVKGLSEFLLAEGGVDRLMAGVAEHRDGPVELLPREGVLPAGAGLTVAATRDEVVARELEARAAAEFTGIRGGLAHTE